MNRYIESVRFNGGIDESSYLSALPVVTYLTERGGLDFGSSVTFFTGENGSGKSTLTEAIAVCFGFNSEGGSKNFNFSTRLTVSELSEHLTIIKSAFPKDGFFLRAESFYNVATDIEKTEVSGYGERSLHEQSHGESFLATIRNRFFGSGIYILDEPEAALSPTSQMALLIEIDELVKKNSQFIIATHSPILLSYPNAMIYEISTSGIQKVLYKETENYKLYKQFIDCPERLLRHLFD